LAKDPTKAVTVSVEFSGVNLIAATNPPTINSSGKDTSFVTVSLSDAAKNPIVGEKLNFYPRHPDFTHLIGADSVTNNRGEAHCKVVGTGSGSDTISVKAAGAVTATVISYSSNYLVIDTPSWQPCIANGKDSTRLRIVYRQGDGITPIQNAAIDVSVTIGSMSSTPVFLKKFTLTPADNGAFFFYMKNPNFANTATITASAVTSQERTSASYQLYFRSSKIKRIELSGSPEVIATNNGSNANKAKIIGVAFDSMDNRVQGELVAFNLLHGPGGGEYIDPPTAITGADGSVTTYIISGTTPSMFRDVWVTAGDLSSIKSDTIKFTIAGPPYKVSIGHNILEGHDFKDGTFGLPCAAIVTDINGNPVADGTQVTFSLKTSGFVYKYLIGRKVETAGVGAFACNTEIDTVTDILNFEDFNNNFRLDPGEDRNNDGFTNRGADLNGDGNYNSGPSYEDINHDGKRQFDWRVPVEPVFSCSNGKLIYSDFNGNGVWDPIEPINDPDYLSAYYALRADSAYSLLRIGNPISAQDDSLLKSLAHMDSIYANSPGFIKQLGSYDFNWNEQPYAQPDPAVSIARTIQTINGKAVNEVIYGQSNASKVEVMIWAESQGVENEFPTQLILPVIRSTSTSHRAR